MTRAFRRTRFASLLVAVALFATMPVAVSLHGEGDDAFCNPTVGLHDASAHRIGAAESTLPHAQHCVLCHAMQSLRAVQTSVPVASRPPDARLVASSSAAVVHALVASTRPARAPPLA